MKKLAVVSLTFLFSAMVLNSKAQEKDYEANKGAKTESKILAKLEKGSVSEVAKQQFNSDFGNIPDVQWKRSVNFDEATFTQDGRQKTAYYDSHGKLAGTTTLVAYPEIPIKGQNEINTKYKDYTPGSVIFFNDNEANDTDMVLYGVQFDDADCYFVELTKGPETIIVRVDTHGFTSMFKKL